MCIRDRAKAGKGNDSSLLTRLTINPFTGIPLLLLVLAGIYLVVGVFLAQTVVGFTPVSYTHLSIGIQLFLKSKHNDLTLEKKGKRVCLIYF